MKILQTSMQIFFQLNSTQLNLIQFNFIYMPPNQIQSPQAA